MASIPKIHARTAGYIVDDLRRRRLAVDKLLQEVGLEKADLSNPENRLPQTPVFHLMEQAASLAGDASYGLRLGASLDPRDRGVLGFIVLNSPTLLDAMNNIQRFYKVGREGHDCSVERYGPQVAFRFRVADPGLRGLRHTSEYLAATVVRGCRDLTWQSISPVRAEFIHDEPDDRVEYFKFLGCQVKFGAEWDAVIYAEETTRLPVKGADTEALGSPGSHLPGAPGAYSQGARSRPRGPPSYHRKAASGLGQHQCNCRRAGSEQQDLGAPAGGTGRKLQRPVGPDPIQCSDALPREPGHGSHPGRVPGRLHRIGGAGSGFQTLDWGNAGKIPRAVALRDVNQSTRTHSQRTVLIAQNRRVASPGRSKSNQLRRDYGTALAL